MYFMSINFYQYGENAYTHTTTTIMYLHVKNHITGSFCLTMIKQSMGEYEVYKGLWILHTTQPNLIYTIF